VVLLYGRERFLTGQKRWSAARAVTDFIRNETLLWLRANLAKGTPVFSWSATPACHGPNSPGRVCH
jgi:hypothetical protein